MVRTSRVAATAAAAGRAIGWLLGLILVWLPVPACAHDGWTALGGHVLPALTGAQRLPAAETVALDAPMTLTLVLNRRDAAGFEAYRTAVQDPASPDYRRYRSPAALADRFGPSATDYAAVRDYFANQGFAITAESAGRLMLSVTGSRDRVAAALDVAIDAYALPGGGRHFLANAGEPSLPAAIAPLVQSISGLSTLARIERLPSPQIVGNWGYNCANGAGVDPYTKSFCYGVYQNALGMHNNICSNPVGILLTLFLCRVVPILASPLDAPLLPAGGDALPGTGQTVGLVQFDSFHVSDIRDFLDLIGAPATQIGQLSSVAVNGGAAVGANEDEVVLDISVVMATAPGANVVVYSAPFTGAGSFQALFSRMLDDGVDVISNSWAYCEDQTTLADVRGVDAILATAAAAGISVFNASGDTGSTCLDGASNTITVPAGSPNATAVGGTSTLAGPGGTYASATWWGQGSSAGHGQGGYGVSRFFARPAYQIGLNASAMRSVPDLAVNADPATNGVPICQASRGGCPSGLLYGGTSMSAPLMAAFAATLNHAQGTNLGLFNAHAYPLANTAAFHGAAALGSDFAHVGLGSPNLSVMNLALAGQTPGPASAATSRAIADPATGIADGTTATHVVVQLRDAAGSTVGGRRVSLTAPAGAAVTITPSTPVTTTAANGTAVFAVTRNAVGTATLSARAIDDGFDVGTGLPLTFVAPPAAAGGILAFPITVTADGVATTTVTVTLRDAGGRPTPGKHVVLSQGQGRSAVTGPNPPVTDANGEIRFTASNRVEESVGYTAVDVTDGELPVPGTATVTYSNAVGSCVTAPVAASGHVLTAFANGFAAYPFFYGNVNWGCSGASNPAFSADGAAYVAHFQTGDLYRLRDTGGTAVGPLSNLGVTLGKPVFGKDGKLYATRGVTGASFGSGDIIEIDPDSGAHLRIVANNLTCPHGLATDPLSGDLFFDNSCSGAGSDNPSLYRLTDPGDTDPSRPTAVTVYATLPGTPNGLIAIAPNGTIYVATAYSTFPHSPLIQVAGTDRPQPASVTTMQGFDSFYWINIGEAGPDGAARSLLVWNDPDTLYLVDLTTTPVTRTALADHLGTGTIGADGCLYSSTADAVHKLTPASGACDFASSNPAPALGLDPRLTSPDPLQGTTLTLQAKLAHASVAAGTPVRFLVEGANAQVRLARTDANGIATLSYVGTRAGSDVVTALLRTDTLDLTSNPARVTFAEGRHATFLALGGAQGAVAARPVALTARLTDISAASTPSPVAGAALSFAVGGHTCVGTTDATGLASCTVTLALPGSYTLAVQYAGSSTLRPASATRPFAVTAAIDRIFADGFETP